MHVNTNQKRIITSKQNKEYVQEQRGSFQEEPHKKVCTIKIAHQKKILPNQLFNKEIKCRLPKELSKFKNKKECKTKSRNHQKLYAGENHAQQERQPIGPLHKQGKTAQMRQTFIRTAPWKRQGNILEC